MVTLANHYKFWNLQVRVAITFCQEAHDFIFKSICKPKINDAMIQERHFLKSTNIGRLTGGEVLGAGRVCV